MKRIAQLSIMGLVLTMGLIQAKNLDKVRIGYVAEPAHGLFFLAQEKGFFKEQGIEAQLLELSGPDGFSALTADKLDVVTYGSTGPLFYIAKGLPLTIFGGIMIEGQATIVRPENFEYYKSNDLNIYKGKKIAYVHTAEAEYIFKDALDKAGIDWKKDVTWLEFSSPTEVVEAVNKKTADVGFSWPPHYSLAVKNYGLKVSHYFSEWLPRYTCCRLTTTTAKLAANPDLYKRFLKALLRAYDFYRTNEDETVKIYTKCLKIDEDIVRRETYTDHVADSDPDPLKNTLQQIWGFIVKNGDAPKDFVFDWDKRVNTSVYKQALEETIKKYPGNKTYAAALVRFKKYDE